MALATRYRTFLTVAQSDVVSTNAASELSAVHEREAKQYNRATWDKLIDHSLIEWGRDPSQIDDGESPTPSRKTIQTAFQLAVVLRDAEWSVPTRIVPDVHAGIVFERVGKSIFESIHIFANGEIEYRRFKNGHLERREPWAFEADQTT